MTGVQQAFPLLKTPKQTHHQDTDHGAGATKRTHSDLVGNPLMGDPGQDASLEGPHSPVNTSHLDRYTPDDHEGDPSGAWDNP